MTTDQEIVVAGPDERLFRAHLGMVGFRSGADRGRWRLVSLSWPHAVIAVTAAKRPDSPDEYFLRFELTGYPQQPPMGAPWDPVANAALPDARWPRGEIVGSVFRTDWQNGQGLYAPYDRSALPGHPDWPTVHRADAWTHDRDISFVLKRVHRLLTDDDYRGGAL